MKTNVCYQGDCLDVLPTLPDNSVDLTLTDIPYNEVNRKSQGLRVLDKENADILTFDLDIFLEQILRVSKNSIIIFCGREQFSDIYSFFAQQKGTVRPIVWQKSNPSPMNGQHIYLSGVEFAVWFKKSGAKTFNAHCKNTVFKYSNGSSKLHPTEKNHGLLKELILDNSNEGDVVLDPCCGSGSHILVAKENNRNYIGIELDKNYFKIATDRVGCEIIKQDIKYNKYYKCEKCNMVFDKWSDAFLLTHNCLPDGIEDKNNIKEIIIPIKTGIDNAIKEQEEDNIKANKELDIKHKINLKICPLCGGKIKGRYCEDCFYEVVDK